MLTDRQVTCAYGHTWIVLSVVQVTTTSRRRGAEMFASQLGRSLQNRDHRVVTVALEVPATRGSLEFAAIGNPRRDPAALRRLLRTIRDADLAVAHGGSTLQPVALAASIARRPFVYRNIGDPSYWGDARAAQLRVGMPLRRSAAVLALYEGARDYMVDRYRLDPRRVVVAPNAVDPTAFPERTPALRAGARHRLGIEDDRVVLGYLGNLSGEKRPQWALATAEAVTGSTLVMAGDGPLRGELGSRAQRLGERNGAPACRLLGPVDDPAGFLAALDVLLLPSATEGIPGVLLEAALIGVPTVATTVGGVSEVVAAVGGVAVSADDLAGFVTMARRVAAEPGDYPADRDAVLRHYGIDAVTDTFERVLVEVHADQPLSLD